MTDLVVAVTTTELVFDGQSPASLFVETPAFELIAAAEQGPPGRPGPQGDPGAQGNPGPAGTAELDPAFILDGGNF